MNRLATSARARIGLGLFSFVVLGVLILNRPVPVLQDYDQPFYITVGYDLYRWGVFSNGIVADSESKTDTDSNTRPPPGMFFGPVYPVLVYAAMKLDPRFAAAVRCSVEADRDNRDYSACDRYVLPMRLLNAFLLSIAVVALASAAEIIFARRWIFVLTGAIALGALACEALIFSFVMTEATIFSLYSGFALVNLLAWKSGRLRYFLLAGLLLGLLCLTKPSFLVMFPCVLGLSALYLYWLAKPRPACVLRYLVLFSLAFAIPVGGWATRNLAAVGKFGLTEEYGSAALIERFAYDDMTAREFLQAFPYCTPGIGELAFRNGDSMHRFVYSTKGSFFQVGRDRRDALTDTYHRLDPLIGGIVRDEMQARWWRYLLVSVPLVWCGMWPGWLVSLLAVPLFAGACIRSIRKREPLFLLYTLPTLVNLALDGLVGNTATRYNLILIGPYAIGAASLLAPWLETGNWPLSFHRFSLRSAGAAAEQDVT